MSAREFPPCASPAGGLAPNTLQCIPRTVPSVSMERAFPSGWRFLRKSRGESTDLGRGRPVPEDRVFCPLGNRLAVWRRPWPGQCPGAWVPRMGHESPRQVILGPLQWGRKIRRKSVRLGSEGPDPDVFGIRPVVSIGTVPLPYRRRDRIPSANPFRMANESRDQLPTVHGAGAGGIDEGRSVEVAETGSRRGRGWD